MPQQHKLYNWTVLTILAQIVKLPIRVLDMSGRDRGGTGSSRFCSYLDISIEQRRY